MIARNPSVPPAGARKDKHYIQELLEVARSRGASDLHIQPGDPARLRVDGEIVSLAEHPFVDASAIGLFEEECFTADQRERMKRSGQTEGRYASDATGPVRLQAYRSSNGTVIAARLLSSEVPKLDVLGLPEFTERIPLIRNGLVLFTGETGCGKSTTLAAIIDRILDTRAVNVITFEDPIEYEHRRHDALGNPRPGTIHQISVGRDIVSYHDGLKSALRSDPDVIMVGEMRDQETILTTLELASTGHLVLATAHDKRATKTVERLTNSFEPAQQARMNYALSNCLRAIVSLRLLPKANGRGRISAGEVFVVTDSNRQLLQKNEISQLDNSVSQGRDHGMISLEESLAKLVSQGFVTPSAARAEIDDDRQEQLSEMFSRHKVARTV